MISTRLLLSFALAALTAGCAAPDKLCRVRSLSTVTEPRDVGAWAGSFEGIKALLEQSPTGNVNLLYVHGIGWSQHEEDEPFGKDLAKMLSKSLGATVEWPDDTQLCPRSTLELKEGKSRSTEPLAGGLMLTSRAPTQFQGDDPEQVSNASDLGCVDRIVLRLPSSQKTITLHRFFWDDALWDSVEWPLVGYDDPVAVLESGQKDPNVGYDNLDALRAKVNRQLKNNVITWGLTDAAAYMGPVGRLAREGVGAAICVATSDQPDIISQAPVQKRSEQRSWRIRSSTDACSESTSSRPHSPFAVFSHSLGSRVVFDTLTRDLDKDIGGTFISARLNQLPNKQHTVYLMANQIPLLAAGRLHEPSTQSTAVKKLTKPLTFVAFSEINDLMTYELVPYFEHMVYMRHRENYNTERATRLRTAAERQKLVEQLGFDVVDVRLSFASKLPVLDFVLPQEAHSNFFSNSRHVSNLVVNGLSDGATLPTPHDDCAP